MTSDLGPRGRGFSRRTTSLNTSSVSPLGRGRSSGGAGSRSRRTTSLRSMTARLMGRASPPRGHTGQGRRRSVDAPGRCGRRRADRRWRLLVLRGGRLREEPGVVALPRRRDLAQQLGDLRLDVLVGDVVEAVVLLVALVRVV